MPRYEFIVRIRAQDRQSFDLDEARERLYSQFGQSSGVWIEGIPNRVLGFGVIIGFSPEHSLLDVTEQLRLALDGAVPGALLRHEDSFELAEAGQRQVLKFRWDTRGWRPVERELGQPDDAPAGAPERPAQADERGASAVPLPSLPPQDSPIEVSPAPEPPATADGAASPAARYVNTLVARSGAQEPVPADQPLAAAADYDVLVNIGRYAEGSLLSREDAHWPDDLLPEQGLWLYAALTHDGGRESATRPFFLPRHGESFACDCPAGGEHADDCARRTWVRLPLRTPAADGIVQAELVIYYQVAAVHAEHLSLPVGTTMTGGPRAQLIARLTRTFNDLGKLAGRSASIVVSPSSSRIVVNGVELAGNPFGIAARAADTSASNARQLLYNSHFYVRDGAEHTRYDAGHGKKAADFETDLGNLAKEGAALYARLFTLQGADNTIAFSLPELLRHEAELRGRAPVIQVMDAQHDEHAMLWALVYDLPLGGDVSRYQLCPSVHEFGPGSAPGTVVPPFCPHAGEHPSRGNVLCPFGFWGLSCIIEQPPNVGRDLESIVFAGHDPLSFLVATDSSLNAGLTEQHIARLRGRLAGRLVSQPSVATENDLADALGPESMDVVYFYCHSGYDKRSESGAADRYINLGDYWIEPLNVSMWARTSWPDPHWPHRHPLVVLNGCHTTEVTSGTLNSFVPAFTQWAAASGVVGTEVTVEQGLAGWAMEELLAAVAGAATVGQAIRDLRWAMLGRGNVMGLAYTPYCLANLALRSG
jgi:hypothetical protein